MVVELERQIEQTVTQFMIELGIPAHLRGYAFIRRAIIMTLDDVERVYSITKTIYPDIAKEYHTTSAKVERAIRNAIEIGWDRGNEELYKELFGFDKHSGKKRPTNSMYIATIAEYIDLNRMA